MKKVEPLPQMSFDDVMEEPPHYCHTCGAKMKSYWHRITPLLVKSLVKFRAAIDEKGVNKIHLQDDLNLTKTEYNNFQKLRLHGLVAKYKVDGVHITGYWVLTRRGGQFLRGELSIPKRVLTFRNKVVARDEELLYVIDVIGQTPYLETIDTIDYEYIKS